MPAATGGHGGALSRSPSLVADLLVTSVSTVERGRAAVLAEVEMRPAATRLTRRAIRTGLIEP